MKWTAVALAMALAFNAHAGQAPKDAQENLLAIAVNGRLVLDTQLVLQTADGDIYLPVEQWRKFTQVALNLDGKTGLVSARELGLEPKFNAEAQAMDLIVPAKLLPAQQLRRITPRVVEVAPQPKGVFVNYDLAARLDADQKLHASLGHELRIGLGPGTLISTGQLNAEPRGVGYVRGLSTWNLDLLNKGATVQIGDVYSPRSQLAGAVNLGGIRVASDRQLRTDKNFVPVPMLGGIAQTATTAELFLNGDKQGQYSLKPGPWQLDQYGVRPGTNEITTVLRDDFGREQTVVDRFYYAPGNLPAGTSEWDIATGLARGTGDRYSTPAVSASILRGVNRYWTTGAQIQATADARQVGLSQRLVLGTKGALTVDAAASQSAQGSGAALALSYDYQAQDWSLHAAHARYSDDYWTLARVRDTGLGFNTGLRQSSTVGLAFAPRGSTWSASLAAADATYQDGRSRTRLDAAFRVRKGANDFGAGVSVGSGDRTAFLTYRHRFENFSMSTTVRAAPDIQATSMLSGRATVGDHDIDYTAGFGSDGQGTSLFAQGSTRTSKGDASLTIQHDKSGTELKGRFRGSLWVGEGGVFTQGPSPNGFLLVEVPGRAAIPIQGPGGRAQSTNARGYALLANVPALRKQQVSMDASALPLTTTVQSTRVGTAVGRRAGGKVAFDLTSDHVLELRVKKDGQALAIGEVVSETETVPMGRGGVAFLMKAAPGQKLTVKQGAQVCEARLPATLDQDILEIECR